jgi:uncharacterized repeat protein (TIGR01451 family)
MRRLFSIIAALIVMTAIATAPAMATGTAAGGSISNQAYADYNDNNGNAMARVYSGTITITISQVAAVSVSPASSSASGTNSNTVYIPVQLYNNGNGNDTQTFSYTPSGSWTPTSVKMYYDADKSGTFTTGDTEITASGGNYTTGTIAQDTYYPILIAVGVPDNTTAPNGTSDVITLTTKSNFDISKTAAGTYTTTVLAAVITATKTHTATSGTKPGDQITYLVTMNNTGSVPATNIRATDAIPTGTTFVSGSLEVNYNDTGWTSRPDACTTANACYDSTNKRILIPGNGVDPSGFDLPAGANYKVRIKATVNAGVPLSATISNFAAITYTSGASQITVNTNTDTFSVQQLAAVNLATTTGNKSGNPGDQIVYPFTATNNGNYDDKINFVIASSGGWAWTIYNDANGNGILDGGETALTDTNADGKADTGNLSLNGGSIHLLAVATIAPGKADGTTDTVTITGSSVYDPTKTSALNWTTTVTAPVISVTKALTKVTTNSVDCTPTNTSTGAGCTYVPGSILTYAMTATNGGAGNATSVIISDIAPANTTFVSGSIKTGQTVGTLTARTDASDHDGGRYDAISKIISCGNGTSITIGPGSTWVMQFQVTIN